MEQTRRPKRIAIVGPTYPFKGGIAHHTTLLVQQLRAEGHTVLFISYTRQYPRLLYGRSDRDPSAAPLTTETEYLIDSINPLTWVTALRQTHAFRPDLVVLPWWVPFWAPFVRFFSGRLKRLQPDLPITLVCHNVLPHESSPIKRAVTRFGLAGGDRFLLQAKSEEAILQALLPGRPTQVTPMPTFAALVAADQAPQNEETGPLFPPNSQHKLLFCGIIRPYKGLDLLLDALNLAQAKIEGNFCLAIVGEFWSDVAETEAQIAKYRLEERVIIENRYLSNRRLSAYIDASDVVIFPYRSATQSAMIQTALARSKPVIATDVGGISEAFEADRQGLLLPPDDPAALSDALVRFCNQPDLRQTLNQATKRSHTNGWERFVAALFELNGLES